MSRRATDCASRSTVTLCHSCSMGRISRAISIARVARSSFLLGIMGVGCLVCVACPKAKPPYVARDPALRKLPLYFYPSEQPKARAALIFFGNDVGFWAAHDELAKRLSAAGYTVIGLDVKKYIDGLPEPVEARERAFGSGIDPIIARALRELHADALPLVLGGHSWGADLALWTAAHKPPPHTIGVLALGPTARSHFYVTAIDRANIGEPDEAGSFSIADEIAHIAPAFRIALMRGSKDHRIDVDSALRAAGGSRLHYTVIPFAAHSLRSLTIAGPMIRRALGWVVSGD